ncbi:MAG: 23S rRNA (adenine(2503)-C(2))-methyltransferase RlmN [Francisella sp.]|nr:MAG: 23S rRNA (adenine(2503)-C(2))-methyltransferase RlmN [Francisella sp.]
MERINLLGYAQLPLIELLKEWGEKPFRAQQLLHWIHQNQITDFEQMTDLAKSFRKLLYERGMVKIPPVQLEKKASDGTIKWLLGVDASNAVECVYIPERDRNTLCISSQIGCALNCSFCSTGRQGFNRNLSADEIIGQLWWANYRMGNLTNKRVVSNVVMMGMGEPLANFQALISALSLMLDDRAYGLSRRRVTVSTSGLLPQMKQLAQECPVSLAVSLHAPTNELRDFLVPINKKYPLEELMKTCQLYLARAPRDFITFEYTMIDGINDKPSQAKVLLQLVKDLPCKFNLIPFNSFIHSDFKRSHPQSIQIFKEILQEAGLVVTVRKTRGDEIDAACGQLVGRVKDKRTRSKKYHAISLRQGEGL